MSTSEHQAQPLLTANRAPRETYTDHGPKDANPCRECGMSDWWCLYDINRGVGRCCVWCGLADVHGVLGASSSEEG